MYADLSHCNCFPNSDQLQNFRPDIVIFAPVPDASLNGLELHVKPDFNFFNFIIMGRSKFGKNIYG
jgi:hypothetical protein